MLEIWIPCTGQRRRRHAVAAVAVAAALLSAPAAGGQAPQPAAAGAHAVVWRDAGGTYHADHRSGRVASGTDFIDVTQAALDSLTEGRDWQERVLVSADAEIGPAERERRLRLPGHTVFDVAGTLTVTDQQRRITVVHALNASHIDIPRLKVRGSPRFGLHLQSVSHVHLGDIRMEVDGAGVRIDHNRGRRPGEQAVRSSDIRIDRITVIMPGRGGHGLETYGVDRLQIGSVTGERTGQSVVQLNDTRDASIASVTGLHPDPESGYATLRVANGCERIAVGRVLARGGARGVFIMSGSSNVTVTSVQLTGQERQGILIEDARNVQVLGGVVRNGNGVAVRVASRRPGQGPGPDQPPSEGVAISGLRIVDDRAQPRQQWGILETGPGTGYNRYTDNDLRGAGTRGGIQIHAATSVVRDNSGGGVAAGTVVLQPGRTPAAVIEVPEVPSAASPRLRARVVDPPDTDAAWGWSAPAIHDRRRGGWRFELDWTSDPGVELELEYVVDQN